MNIDKILELDLKKTQEENARLKKDNAEMLSLIKMYMNKNVFKNKTFEQVLEEASALEKLSIDIIKKNEGKYEN